MSSFRQFFLPLAILFHLSTAAHALRVDGIEFDDSVRLGGRDLRLNGVGFRAVAMFKGYAAALYLAERTSAPDKVTALAGPKRLQMRMLVDVPAGEFVKAFDKGVRRNTPPNELPALTERMAQFDAAVNSLGTVRKGDIVDLDFVPEQGLTLMVNSRVRGGPIVGDDLYAALLRVFVGRVVSDDDLKKGLLGAKLPR
jgi:hypothetical protein